MPLKPRTRKLATVALVGTLIGGASGLVVKSAINAHRPKEFHAIVSPEEQKKELFKVLEKTKDKFSAADSYVKAAVRKIYDYKDSFGRKRFASWIYNNNPGQFYDILEHYMQVKARELGLDPEIPKYLFFRTAFNLENPIGVSDLNTISRIVGRTITREELSQDPFLAIDFGLQYLKRISENTKRSDLVGVLTEFLYGPFRTNKAFQKKTKDVRDLLTDYNTNYSSKLDKQKVRESGRAYLKTLDLFVDLSKQLDMPTFERLSPDERKVEIIRFTSLICERLNLDLQTVLRMIVVESHFNHTNQNLRTKALGLLQIEPINFNELNKRVGGFERIFGRVISFEDLRNPYVDLVMGVLYFKYCLISLQDLDAAIQAHNVGLDAYLLGKPETMAAGQRYLMKVKTATIE